MRPAGPGPGQTPHASPRRASPFRPTAHTPGAYQAQGSYPGSALKSCSKSSYTVNPTLTHMRAHAHTRPLLLKRPLGGNAVACIPRVGQPGSVSPPPSPHCCLTSHAGGSGQERRGGRLATCPAQAAWGGEAVSSIWDTCPGPIEKVPAPSPGTASMLAGCAHHLRLQCTCQVLLRCLKKPRTPTEPQ